MIRVLPPIYFLVAVARTITMHFLVPLAVPIPFVWRIVGFLPVAAGLY
jgi:hypothetical protein